MAKHSPSNWRTFATKKERKWVSRNSCNAPSADSASGFSCGGRVRAVSVMVPLKVQILESLSFADLESVPSCDRALNGRCSSGNGSNGEMTGC